MRHSNQWTNENEQLCNIVLKHSRKGDVRLYTNSGRVRTSFFAGQFVHNGRWNVLCWFIREHFSDMIMHLLKPVIEQNSDVDKDTKILYADSHILHAVFSEENNMWSFELGGINVNYQNVKSLLNMLGFDIHHTVDVPEVDGFHITPLNDYNLGRLKTFHPFFVQDMQKCWDSYEMAVSV